MAIRSAQIGVAETNLIVASKETAILSIMFCNVTPNLDILTVYCYESGGVAGPGNTIVKEYPITGFDTFLFTGDEKLILSTGDRITAKVGVEDSITATLSYKEV